MAKAKTPAKPRYNPTDAEKKAIGEVKACIAEGIRWHGPFARRVEKRYEAWRGMQAENAPKTWRSQVHQPLLINVLEGMLSTMEEAMPSWKVKPRIVPGMSMAEAVASDDAAELNQYLLADQMERDFFSTKQRPFMQQDLIAGFTPGKVFWLREEGPRRYLDRQPEMVYDEMGGTIDMANVLDEYEETIVFRDDPTFEVRDVRDWMVPESATSVETSPWILDRTYVHYKTLERMEKLGVYQNTSFVKETRMDSTQQSADVVAEREQRLRGADRTRGLVEIVELWTHDRVITVANRTILLRDEPNPFWHGVKPFVVCSAIPDIFQIPGVSVIEGLAQMQEMFWTLQNTRIDATRMAANIITLIRSDAEGGDFEYAPLAQWIVSDPNQVKTLDINPQIASITLQAESLLKGDIQNVMGGLPYTGGAESQTIDQKTATGISIVTNIAQAVLLGRKQQYLRVFGKIGQLFLALDHQFLREERTIAILGEGGAKRYHEIQPESLKGIFDVSVTIGADSMQRQERRAESGALLTQAVQFLGQSAQAGVRLNIRKFWTKHLEAYDIPDPMSYFLEAPPTAAAAESPPAPGTPPGADTLLEDLSGQLAQDGATNTSLAAGPTSPSSDISLSPAAASSRALAATGAGRSV